MESVILCKKCNYKFYIKAHFKPTQCYYCWEPGYFCIKQDTDKGNCATLWDLFSLDNSKYFDTVVSNLPAIDNTTSGRFGFNPNAEILPFCLFDAGSHLLPVFPSCYGGCHSRYYQDRTSGPYWLKTSGMRLQRGPFVCHSSTQFSSPHWSRYCTERLQGQRRDYKRAVSSRLSA